MENRCCEPMGNWEKPISIAFFVGNVINVALLGVLLMQIYIYYDKFPHDQLRFKLLVALVFALEMAHTTISTSDAWSLFASRKACWFPTESPSLSWLTIPILGGVGQIYFVSRILYLFRKPYSTPVTRILKGFISAIIALFAISGLVGGVLAGVKIAGVNDLHGIFLDKAVLLACGIWNGSAAICDLMISASLLYLVST
ncbi:hypothetical protein AMATHDRAFT_50066 [Amanita thiersii Skay4041]|uniref:G-protein coupled receptors family 1 profile domain-containing protein n=1 Tax=Amanita thiersii Skay4041 TaxID=703135 RepID=A0A2A9NEJ3_9AGAR|nr:hypothetical protein AMATHDRAFT_50066 [Amanita thiersii Skay4041]